MGMCVLISSVIWIKDFHERASFYITPKEVYVKPYEMALMINPNLLGKNSGLEMGNI